MARDGGHVAPVLARVVGPMTFVRLRALGVRTLLVAVVTAATACDGGSGAGGGGGGGDVGTWCAQLDVAVTASAELSDLGRDDPGVDDALATVQDEMATLSSLEPPAAIADDFETVSGPPPTDETGRVDLGGELAESGDRIAAWALRECELSSSARAALTDQRDERDG